MVYRMLSVLLTGRYQFDIGRDSFAPRGGERCLGPLPYIEDRHKGQTLHDRFHESRTIGSPVRLICPFYESPFGCQESIIARTP